VLPAAVVTEHLVAHLARLRLADRLVAIATPSCASASVLIGGGVVSMTIEQMPSSKTPRSGLAPGVRNVTAVPV
jgi:hypothetical protein